MSNDNVVRFESDKREAIKWGDLRTVRQKHAINQEIKKREAEDRK